MLLLFLTVIINHHADRAEAEYSNAATQQEAERAERATKAAAAALKVRYYESLMAGTGFVNTRSRCGL